MKKTSTIKKAQMGAAMPAKKGEMSGSMKKFKPTGSRRSKGPVYEGSTLPEYTVTAPKAKSGTSLGMKSVKSGYDNNPKVTRADIISAGKMKAGKAMYGTKVVGKKPIKKAQTGKTTPSKEGTKMVVDGKEYNEGAMLDEAVVTASRLKPKKSIADRVKSIGDGLGLNRTQKSKPAKRSVHSVKTYRQKGSGPGSGLMKLKQRITRRYKEGGEVEMAKKGTSVKKSMGKCKMGC